MAPDQPWFFFELGFDMLFLVDCFGINFNTALVTDSGLNFDRWEIAKNYLSFWFWIDFPSSIPLTQGFKLAALAEGGAAGDNRIFASIKLIRLARILKLIRLMKAAKIFKIFEEEVGGEHGPRTTSHLIAPRRISRHASPGTALSRSARSLTPLPTNSPHQLSPSTLPIHSPHPLSSSPLPSAARHQPLIPQARKALFLRSLLLPPSRLLLLRHHRLAGAFRLRHVPTAGVVRTPPSTSTHLSSPSPLPFFPPPPPLRWGCEIGPFADDDYGSEVVTAASLWKPDPDLIYEPLTGRPRAPDGFCDVETEGSNERWAPKMNKGWLYVWVLYWTVTTMTTIGYGDFSPKTVTEVILTIVVQLVSRLRLCCSAKARSRFGAFAPSLLAASAVCCSLPAPCCLSPFLPSSPPPLLSYSPPPAHS